MENSYFLWFWLEQIRSFISFQDPILIRSFFLSYRLFDPIVLFVIWFFGISFDRSFSSKILICLAPSFAILSISIILLERFVFWLFLIELRVVLIVSIRDVDRGLLVCRFDLDEFGFFWFVIISIWSIESSGTEWICLSFGWIVLLADCFALLESWFIFWQSGVRFRSCYKHFWILICRRQTYGDCTICFSGDLIGVVVYDLVCWFSNWSDHNENGNCSLFGFCRWVLIGWDWTLVYPLLYFIFVFFYLSDFLLVVCFRCRSDLLNFNIC